MCLNGHKESGKKKSYYVETRGSRWSDGSWDARPGLVHQPAARFLSNWYSRNVTMSEPLWLVCVLMSWPTIGQIQHGHCWRIIFRNLRLLSLTRSGILNMPPTGAGAASLHLYELWDLIKNSWMRHDLAMRGPGSPAPVTLPSVRTLPGQSRASHSYKNQKNTRRSVD